MEAWEMVVGNEEDGDQFIGRTPNTLLFLLLLSFLLHLFLFFFGHFSFLFLFPIRLISFVGLLVSSHQCLIWSSHWAGSVLFVFCRIARFLNSFEWFRVSRVVLFVLPLPLFIAPLLPFRCIYFIVIRVALVLWEYPGSEGTGLGGINGFGKGVFAHLALLCFALDIYSAVDY
ncbi:hypothetical protein BJ508DRAFT_33670 [Ascobolus immersus RN42]|uniref:Uncharacterized protein n=1 Tax=Ascobolus immersus RN42 TaxID=1160509 RepID=A0A3N4HY32_ASCIM|nr:hypothetical protein BJ508DRAFT_33670 [Ascobolus immersus RN42]